jgi:DNA recombination protein RmuC
LNEQVTRDANNLASALKGESKTQGNWGEMILETILEKSGLIKGTHFMVQQSMLAEDGSRVQPDVVVNLPEGRNMVVDSKVSLTAYEQYYSAADDEAKAEALVRHLGSIRAHVKELNEKNYQGLYAVKSPDFVLMFIPVEPAFGLAVQNDSNLFYDAFNRNIVIVSPTTLLATLRTVGSIWRFENQNRNAVEIARRSGALYDKFVSFVNDLEDIGKRIGDTHKSYEAAMAKLSSGTGNLVKRAEEIRKLGAKTNKKLQGKVMDEIQAEELALLEESEGV